MYFNTKYYLKNNHCYTTNQPSTRELHQSCGKILVIYPLESSLTPTPIHLNN